MNIRESVRCFWSASYLYRRASLRSRPLAIKALEHIKSTGAGKARYRAALLLKEIDNVTDGNTTRQD